MNDLDDDSSDAIVSRADAFMKRQRPILSSTHTDLDDLPVLTDIVHPSPPHDAAPEDFPSALATQLEQRLTREIPLLVEAALQAALPGIINDLQHRLQSAARDALQELQQAPATKPHP